MTDAPSLDFARIAQLRTRLMNAVTTCDPSPTSGTEEARVRENCAALFEVTALSIAATVCKAKGAARKRLTGTYVAAFRRRVDELAASLEAGDTEQRDVDG